MILNTQCSCPRLWRPGIAAMGLCGVGGWAQDFIDDGKVLHWLSHISSTQGTLQSSWVLEWAQRSGPNLGPWWQLKFEKYMPLAALGCRLEFSMLVECLLISLKPPYMSHPFHYKELKFFIYLVLKTLEGWGLVYFSCWRYRYQRVPISKYKTRIGLPYDPLEAGPSLMQLPTAGLRGTGPGILPPPNQRSTASKHECSRN